MDAKQELVSETGAVKHAALTLYGYYCLRRNKNTGLCFPSLRKTSDETGITPKSNVVGLRNFLKSIAWIEVYETGVIRPLKGFYSDTDRFLIWLKNFLTERISVLIIRTSVLNNRTLVLIIRTLFKGNLNQLTQPAHLTSVSAELPGANSANAPADKNFAAKKSSPPSPTGFLGETIPGKIQPAGKPTLQKASAGKPADERTYHPAVQMVKEITGRYLPKELWDKAIREIGDKPDKEFFRASWEIWRSFDGKPTNYEKWLFQPNKRGKPPDVFGSENDKSPPGDVVSQPAGGRDLTEHLRILIEVQEIGDDVSELRHYYTPEDWNYLMEELRNAENPG